MEKTCAIGTEWSKLRAVKGAPEVGQKRHGFPVYTDLALTLATLSKVTSPDETARHVCAVLSGWAYSDVDTVAMIMSRMGLERCRVRGFNVANNALLIRTTAYVVQSCDGRVVFLVYRGTDPFDLSTWAVDGDINSPSLVRAEKLGGGALQSQPPIAAAALVHAGFYRNQRATWFEIESTLLRAMEGRSIFEGDNLDGWRSADRDDALKDGSSLEALYITGHSLGAAMAILAAYRIGTDSAYGGASLDGRSPELAASSSFRRVLKQAYVFAPPMVGNDAFATLWRSAKVGSEKLDDCTFAHTYARDVVPHLPPAGRIAYSQVGRHFQSGPSGSSEPARDQWVVAPSPPKQCTVYESAEAVEPLVLGQIRVRDLLGPALGRVVLGAARRKFGTPLSFADHSPANYIRCSQRADQLTEFGDDF